MTKKSPQKNTNTIVSDLTNDLHFLILEIKILFTQVKSITSKVDASNLDKIKTHGQQIENLKNRIESLSYDAIFKLKKENKALISNYRALIRIASNLFRISDFLGQVAHQVKFIKDPELFKHHELDAFYSVIEEQLDLIHKAFTEVDTEAAKKLCDSEIALDNLYLEKFNYIQNHISKSDLSADMLTMLFMVRYFERIGDRLLSIGESILNISVGDAVNIKHYLKLEEAVKQLSPKNGIVDYEFKPFLFSRSGCKVGLIILNTGESKNNLKRYFFKQGDSTKITEEVEGIKLWSKNFSHLVAELMWKNINKKQSAIVVSHLKGLNLLDFIIKKNEDKALETVCQNLENTLESVWNSSKRKSKRKSALIKQILKRKEAIENVHSNFFDENVQLANNKKRSFEKLIKQAQKIESKISIPFEVLCHGDFNLDNVIYEQEKNGISFVDVHRSAYQDYAQDISVFIVSSLRIKISDKAIKKRVNYVNNSLLEFAKAFAIKNNDKHFQVRFALGLFRSFITSTRFVADDEWYEEMRQKAILLIEILMKHKGDLATFEFNLKTIEH